MAYRGIVNVDGDEQSLGCIGTFGERFENGGYDLARTTPLGVEIYADKRVTGLFQGALEFGEALDWLGHGFVTGTGKEKV
jgi:hypothetical protein